jgi:uncharacterized damage-inducible protein DinB
VEQFCVDYLERLQDLNRDFMATFEDLPADALDWRPGADMNSFGVSVVHTTGSARFWIGVALGEPPDRNRDLEFQAQGLSVAELKAHFAALEEYARVALERITLADLAVIRSVPNHDRQVRRVSAGWALLHALEHTGLHLGLAQMTRQLWEQR